MKNKRIRNAVIIVVVLLLLSLLLLGTMLFSQREKEPGYSGNKEEKEQVMIIEDNDTNIIWEREEFDDKTTDMSPSTNATQKGGSETLEIIKSEDEDDSETNEEAEIRWLEGIW